MKKYLMMFAFMVCGLVAFTACSDEEGGGDNKSVFEMYEDGVTAEDDLLVLKYSSEGTDYVIVAKFDDGKCVSYITYVRFRDLETQVDGTSTFQGMGYEILKITFEEIWNSEMPQ